MEERRDSAERILGSQPDQKPSTEPCSACKECRDSSIRILGSQPDQKPSTEPCSARTPLIFSRDRHHPLRTANNAVK